MKFAAEQQSKDNTTDEPDKRANQNSDDTEQSVEEGDTSSKVKSDVPDPENVNIHIKDNKEVAEGKEASNEDHIEKSSESKEAIYNDNRISKPTDESSAVDEVSSENAEKPSMRKDIKPAERPPSITGQRKSSSTSPPGLTSPTFVKEVTLPQKTVKLPESLIVKKPSPKSEPEESEQLKPKAPSLPPFMSTTLLQPVKAHEIPKPAVSAEDLKVKQENQLRWEKLRELEEELLGDKKKTPKVSETESENEEEIVDERDIGEILEEEYALKMEEEELIAIGE